MSDLGRRIEKQVREALRAALAKGPTNVAGAANIGADGHSVSVYSDQDVTIVQRDGRTHVIRHDADEPHGAADGGSGGSAGDDAGTAVT